MCSTLSLTIWLEIFIKNVVRVSFMFSISLSQGLVCCGSGEPGVDEHRSFVLYHSNSPRWAEQIKLPIPLEMFHGTHLRFELRHCSSKTLLCFTCTFFLKIDFTSTCYSTFWDFRLPHYQLIPHNYCSLCSCSKGKRGEEAFWLLFCPSDAGQWETAAWWDAWAHCPQGTVSLCL